MTTTIYLRHKHQVGVFERTEAGLLNGEIHTFSSINQAKRYNRLVLGCKALRCDGFPKITGKQKHTNYSEVQK